MPLKITKSSDPIEVERVKVMLYGQPGVGKTSTAFTSGRVLLLDCDNGAYRSAFRKDAVQVSAWPDIANITQEDLEGYDVVAIDTVGRLLDFLASDIIRLNPKMGFNGALSLQGYGQLKSQFASWIKHLTTLGKDIVMIAHDKEERRGDETVVRPDIQGGSYSEVFKQADAVGYMYMADTGKTLDFNPTRTWEGKNVAALPPIKVPAFTEVPDFFTEILVQIKESMNRMSEEGRMIADVVAKQRKDIEKAKDAAALNKLLDVIQGLPQPAQQPVKRLVWQRAKDAGIVYDKDAHQFIDAPEQVTE